jgi:broad specificity phosphatase PhoE
MTNGKTFWFIRHGESEGNAGLRTPSAGDIHITQRGKLQAYCIPDQITQKPELFVVSSFCRTTETAAPTFEKYPSVPVETWDIEEYTYLPTKLHTNTSSKDRRWPAIRYFMRANPELVTGPGAESFNQLIERVDHTLERLISNPTSFTVLFSHGWFMRTLLWRLIFFQNIPNTISLAELKGKTPIFPILFKHFSRTGGQIKGNHIKHFLKFSGIFSVPNGSIMKFRMDVDDPQIHFDELQFTHISPELRGNKISDR